MKSIHVLIILVLVVGYRLTNQERGQRLRLIVNKVNRSGAVSQHIIVYRQLVLREVHVSPIAPFIFGISYWYKVPKDGVHTVTKRKVGVLVSFVVAYILIS